jgi:hypothetical protein
VTADGLVGRRVTWEEGAIRKKPRAGTVMAVGFWEVHGFYVLIYTDDGDWETVRAKSLRLEGQPPPPPVT